MFLYVCSLTNQVSTEDKVDFKPWISTLDAFSLKRAREEFETKTKPTRFSSDVIVTESYVTVPGEPDALDVIGLTGNTYPAHGVTNFTKCNFKFRNSESIPRNVEIKTIPASFIHKQR